MPRAQTSNPSMTDVLLLLAMTMEFLRRFLSAPANAGAGCRRSQPKPCSRWVAPGRALELWPCGPRSEERRVGKEGGARGARGPRRETRSLACVGAAVFFFQAEDGIRDIGVTGVQTCALPI